jgi:hypothetical protein
MFLPEIIRQLGVRHQVEPQQLHVRPRRLSGVGGHLTTVTTP